MLTCIYVQQIAHDRAHYKYIGCDPCVCTLYWKTVCTAS